MIKKWQVINSKITYQDKWLKIRSDHCLTGQNKIVKPYHVLEYPTWVNVVALTPKYEIILVKQYRHGAGKILRGLPSGSVNPTDKSLTAAIRRELKEETGFSGGKFYEIGQAYVNPAMQNNFVHSFLAIGVKRKLSLKSYTTMDEETEVLIKPFLRVVKDIESKKFEFQSLYLLSIFFAINFLLTTPKNEFKTLKYHLQTELLR